jgi:hypothetical protein
MSKRDEPPSKIGHRKLLKSKQGELCHWHPTAAESLWRHVCRFLLKQAGSLWADVWPEVDELLRHSDAGGHTVAEVRRRLHRSLLEGNPGHRCARSNGMRLHIDPNTGTLLATPGRGKVRSRPQVTFSVAELRHGPELITR